MEFWIQIIASIVISAIASSGLWAFIQKKMDKKDAKTQLLVGMAHDRIIEYLTAKDLRNIDGFIAAIHPKITLSKQLFHSITLMN